MNRSRKATLTASILTAVVSAGGMSAGAADIDYDTNLALGAAGILGASDDPAILGRVFVNGTVDSLDHINDGDLGTGLDTWDGSKDEDEEFYDFGGVAFASPQNNVAAVRFYHETFGDGGWFDYPGLNITELDPDGDDGQNLSILPRIQYTTDGGTSWIYVTGSSDNYDDVINDTTMPTFSGARSAVIDFTFDPVSGINGIRVIGDGWGPAGNNLAGFIGFKEFEVYAIPEPSMALMLGLGAASLLIRRHRASDRAARFSAA